MKKNRRKPANKKAVKEDITPKSGIDSTSRSENNNKDQEIKKEDNKTPTDKKTEILTPLRTFFLGLLTAYITTYIFPYIFNKPNITIAPTPYPYVKGIISDTINVEPDSCNAYKARFVDEATGEPAEDELYDFIRGDAHDPGYVVVALGLYNHGKSHAIIDSFTVDVIGYKPIDNTEYMLYNAGEIDDPDQYVILYDSVDPLIVTSMAQPAKVSEDGTTEILDYNQFNLRLSPDEHGTYYMKISFLEYGTYDLNISVNYDYKGKTKTSNANDQIHILYDGLTDEQIIEKQHG